MIYERTPRNATEIMRCKMIVSRQRIPEGYIVVYTAVIPSGTGGIVEVLSVSTEKVVVKKHLCWRIWIWLFGESYRWESRSDHLNRQVSDSILK